MGAFGIPSAPALPVTSAYPTSAYLYSVRDLYRNVQKNQRQFPSSRPVGARPRLEPELGLIVAAAAKATGGDVQISNVGVRRESVEWDRVLRLARRHGVVPHLDAAIDEMDATAPEAFRSSITDHSITQRHKNLQYAAEVHRILDEFADEGLRALPYKGPVVAIVAYDDLGLRVFGDLDFLVLRDDLPSAAAALESMGYTLESGLGPYTVEEIPDGPRGTPFPFPGELKFVDEDRGLEVELRTESGDVNGDGRLDVRALWENRTTVQLAGKPCVALSPTDRLVVLACHGAKHVWRRLEWLSGLAGAANRTDADWAVATERAHERNCVRELYLGALLVEALFDVDLPSDVERAAKSDERCQSVSDHILRRLQRDPLAVPSELQTQRTLGTLRGDGRTRYLRHALRPRAEDYETIELPEPLWPMYRGIRFARVGTKVARSFLFL